MTRSQAGAFLAAVDALPEELGKGYTFVDGHPCCALGHLAARVGYLPGPRTTLDDGVATVCDTYGSASIGSLAEANDDAPPTIAVRTSSIQPSASSATTASTPQTCALRR